MQQLDLHDASCYTNFLCPTLHNMALGRAWNTNDTQTTWACITARFTSSLYSKNVFMQCIPGGRGVGRRRISLFPFARQHWCIFVLVLVPTQQVDEWQGKKILNVLYSIRRGMWCMISCDGSLSIELELEFLSRTSRGLSAGFDGGMNGWVGGLRVGCSYRIDF